MMYVYVCSIHNINISKLEVLILLVFRLGDGTKVVCDQVRVVGFGMQDRITSKKQIFCLSGSREETSRLHKANSVMSLRILRECFSVVICQLSL